MDVEGGIGDEVEVLAVDSKTPANQLPVPKNKDEFGYKIHQVIDDHTLALNFPLYNQMGDPNILDPIPEDNSVAAYQHAVTLSTTSAVASSVSGGMAVRRDNTATNITKSKCGKKRRGKRRQRGVGGTDTARILEFDESAGAAAISDDAVSDANASLGGAAEHDLEGPFSSSPSTKRTDDDNAKKIIFSSPQCKKRSLIFLGIISILLVVIGVGMYFILNRLPIDNDENVDILPSLEASPVKTPSPTPNPKFPPFEISYVPPSSSPIEAYTSSEVKMLDFAFQKASGTDHENMYDMNTPEGKCRDWMIYSDQSIDMDEDEEQHAQQRYILCVLYYSINGDFWTKNNNWLDAKWSECDWYGITCSNETSIIKWMDLSKNNATGPLPTEIESLSNLVTLNLNDNSISSTIPDKLFDSMEDLITLNLEENQIKGTIPKRTTSASASKLRFLYLGGNQLTGDIPFFPNIVIIGLSRNNLTSIDLRRYFTSSPSLIEFRAYANELSGPLPKIWNTPNLTHLDLALNSWTGSIPQDLLDLPSIKNLLLEDCNLTGSLPAFSTSTTMNHLWLDSNSLSGSIPSNFGLNWTNLYSLRLQDNNLLTGEITLEQCDRWDGSRSNNSTETEGFLSASSSSNSNSSSLGTNCNISSLGDDSYWELNTDCKIDCACCTNTNCIDTPAATGGDTEVRYR